MHLTHYSTFKEIAFYIDFFGYQIIFLLEFDLGVIKFQHLTKDAACGLS